MQIGFFAAGGILIALGCYWLWRLLSETDTDKHAQGRHKIGYAILVLIAGGVVVLSGCSPLPMLFLVGSIFIMVDIWLFRIMKKSESKTVVCALLLIAGGIMALSSFAPLAAKTEAPNTVSVLPTEAAPKESEQVKVEVPPVETPLQTATPSPTPTDESKEEKSLYFSEVKSSANDTYYYTVELFSDLVQCDYDDENWQEDIDSKVVLVRTYIEDLKLLVAPDGLDEVQAGVDSVANSCYIVTEKVALAAKSADYSELMDCSESIEIAQQDYDSLMAVIGKHNTD